MTSKEADEELRKAIELSLKGKYLLPSHIKAVTISIIPIFPVTVTFDFVSVFVPNLSLYDKCRDFDKNV